MSIKTAIKYGEGNVSKLLLANHFNKLFFEKAHSDEVRSGLHASSIITGEEKFCIREQVLSLFFHRNTDMTEFPVHLLRIFKEGNAIHEKWQTMFVENGIALGIEERIYSEYFDLYLTPDAVIELKGVPYIVEIKSCNSNSYRQIRDTHPAGNKQLQMYMHFACIPRGIVLCENKDTQEFNPIPCDYDYTMVVPYLERLHMIKAAKEKYLKNGKLPRGTCTTSTCSRAGECQLSNACFGIDRIELD